VAKEIQEQPLTLYKWINNEIYSSVAKVRQKYLNNLKLLIISQLGDLSNDSRSKKGRSILELKSTHSKVNSSQINSNKQNSSGTKDLQPDLPIIKEEYNENTDKEIQEKYLKDLMVKYKYNISDINERLIMINDETKKIISEVIMENTLYNIISQGVYGEEDLTVKPRIYFFLNKNEEINKTLANNDKKEETKTQNEGNKEENKNNNNISMGSKNMVKSMESNN
jgi:hypothetical protein